MSLLTGERVLKLDRLSSIKPPFFLSLAAKGGERKEEWTGVDCLVTCRATWNNHKGIILRSLKMLLMVSNNSFFDSAVDSEQTHSTKLCKRNSMAISWFFPIIIGVVMWVAIGLRQPVIFSLAMGKSLLPSNSRTEQS